MCTNINIKSKQGNVYWGRTLDFMIDPFTQGKGEITIIPKGIEYNPTGKNSWIPKYSFMGISILNKGTFMDGINEKGLVGGSFYLEECSWCKKEEILKSGKKALMGEEVIAWVLSHYDNVDDIAKNIINFGMLDAYLEGFTNQLLPIHFTFTDKEGKSIVIEPTLNGFFKVFQNTLGVMTNSPTYDWHMTNLRNYINLSDHNGDALIVDKNNILPIESGSGMLGLPGDYTSPSRFIKAFYISKFIDSFDDKDGITTLFNTFSTVIIPKGLEKIGNTSGDFTYYWSGYDVKNKTLFVKPYDSLNFTSVIFDDNLINSDKIITLPIHHEQKTIVEPKLN